MQPPGVVTVVGHRQPLVVRHQVGVDRQDGLGVRLDPRHLVSANTVRTHYYVGLLTTCQLVWQYCAITVR